MILLICVLRQSGKFESGAQSRREKAFSEFVARTPACRALVINEVTNVNGMPLPQLVHNVQTIVQLWLASEEVATAVMSTAAFGHLEAALRDLGMEAHWLVATRNVSIAYPKGEPAGDVLPASVQPAPPHLKRMTLLRRKAGTTSEQFSDWWRSTHVPLVLDNMSGDLLGYAQNQVLKAAHPCAEALCDGVTELVLDGASSMKRLFPARDRNDVTGHADAMIGAMSSFTVHSTRVN